ncbi:MAG: hypothetical protein LBH40_00065 [Alphaproteobacteria bacterium]|jgi:lipopolysaccharide biosynthesis glycosyltransferase|nr:hypothetical protein [Alphaproteobacteria bacterium]
MKSYNIAFAINKNFLLFCFIAIYSLLRNNQTSFFNIFIQHNNCLNQEDIDIFLSQYPLKNFNNFKIHLIDCSTIEELKDITDGGKWTKEVYFKLFLADLLTVDKVLFLDADVLITSNIEDFLNTNLENHAFCGDNFKNSNIVNCGIFLMNLKLLRETNIHKEIFTIIKKQYLTDKTDFYKLTEEYVINHFFASYILFTDKIISISSTKRFYAKEHSMIHYVGIKPWHLDRKISKEYKPLYLNYLDNLKPFAKSKTSRILIIVLFYYLLHGGYIINSFAKRIKNSVYKNIFKLPKYKYLHKGLTMSFIIKGSIPNK